MLGVSIVARPVEVRRHDRDEIGTVLLTIGFDQLDPGAGLSVRKNLFQSCPASFDGCVAMAKPFISVLIHIRGSRRGPGPSGLACSCGEACPYCRCVPTCTVRSAAPRSYAAYSPLKTLPRGDGAYWSISAHRDREALKNATPAYSAGGSDLQC
jgi:hypothetical protein